MTPAAAGLMRTTPAQVTFVAYLCQLTEADTGTAAGFVHEESGKLIDWPLTFSPRWRKSLVDQSIICSFEWVDELDALQDEPILQIFSEQAPHAGTLRRSPQSRPRMAIGEL